MRLFLFFFKQKTAYEMRISDWSSDVCSSDLRDQLREADGVPPLPSHRLAGRGAGAGGDLVRRVRAPVQRRPELPRLADLLRSRRVADRRQRRRRPRRHRDPPGGGAQGLARTRTEGHTSELQALMRISYAVLSLKKKSKAQKQNR